MCVAGRCWAQHKAPLTSRIRGPLCEKATNSLEPCSAIFWVAHFACARMGVCWSQYGTVRFCVRLVVPQQYRLIRHATHPMSPFGPSTQLEFCPSHAFAAVCTRVGYPPSVGLKGNQHQRLPASPDLEELNAEWTDKGEGLVRHTAWMCRIYTLLLRLFSNQGRGQHIKAKPIRTTQDQMYSVDRGTSQRMMGESFLLRRKDKASGQPEATWQSTPRTVSSVAHRGEGLHPGARHLLVREVCGRFSFGKVCGAIVL